MISLVEQLLKSKSNKASYEDVSIEFTNKFSKDLLELYVEMYNDEFTSWREPNEPIMSKKDLEDELKANLERKTKTPGLMPLMHILYNGKLVGFSFPRKCNGEVDLNQFKITESENYYKIGNFIIDSKFRGMGIGSIAALRFQEKYKKIVYTPVPENVASIHVAMNLGLKLSHSIYNPVVYWSFTPNNFGNKEFLVYKN